MPSKAVGEFAHSHQCLKTAAITVEYVGEVFLGKLLEIASNLDIL